MTNRVVFRLPGGADAEMSDEGAERDGAEEVADADGGKGKELSSVAAALPLSESALAASK